MRRLALGATLCTVVVSLSVTALPAADAQPTRAATIESRHPTRLRTGTPAPLRLKGTPTAAGRELLRQGYLVPNEARYMRQKVAAARETATGAAAPSAMTSLLATTVTKWAGVKDPNVAPSDSTGAVGPTRYVELVNENFGIYDRTLTPPAAKSTGSLLAFTGDCSTCDISDPQAIWDPTTNRFYYAALDFTAALTGIGNNYLTLGFSKGASPNTASDWCKYSISFNNLLLPDYPKLGDTKDFWMIGSNVFNSSGSFVTGAVTWISKPIGTGTITTCPLASSFKAGTVALSTPRGTPAFTPVPANQIDTSSTGWVVAHPGTFPAGSVLLYKVTKSSTGTAVFSAATAITVPSYSVPPSVPEAGSTFHIDTLDSRFTQAVAAIDPICKTATGALGAVTVWTQHTVKGGAGSVVAWDEIDTSTNVPCQSGVISPSGQYAFNGAVSPDRLVSGTTAKFGSDVVLGFNTSSATTDPTIWMASSLAHAPMTAPVKIVGATGPYSDGFTCPAPPKGHGLCRWGDYSAATPDPSPTLATATKGRVWLSNMFSANTVASGGPANWLTENWAATP